MKRKDDTALPLEERMEERMAGISARVKEMDGKCREMLEFLPEIPVNLDGYTLDEVEKVMDEECRRLSLCSRKGMSRREWGALEKEIQTRRAGFWKEYVMMCDSDYDCAYLFGILRFKLRWMVFYWENFGHGDEGDGTLSQMRLAVRLLDIVRRHGLDGPLPGSLPYVNVRNRARFNGFIGFDDFYSQDEARKVRFRKAWCLLWKLMKETSLGWWD